MKHKEIHKAIQKKFHLNNSAKRNLPYCSSQRYQRNLLPKLYAELGFKIGCEIGVRRGQYSQLLCKANPELFLYCIDPWAPIGNKYSQERQNGIYESAISRLSQYNTKIIRKPSLEALKHIKDNELDFIFIDGNHTFDAAMMDIILYSHKVRSGGIVSVHDVYHGETGVVKAVEAYTHSHNINPWYFIKEIAPTVYWVKP